MPTLTEVSPTLEECTGFGNFDPVHITCCDNDIALCGEPVATHEWVADWDPGEDCAMCIYVIDQHLPCTVPGCTGGCRHDVECE